MHVHTRIDRGPALRSVAARADGKRGGRFGPLARHASWLHAARKVGSRRSGSTCAVHARSDGRAVSAGVSATTLHDALSCATTRSAAVATIANKVAHAPRMRTALAGAVVQGQKKTRAAVFFGWQNVAKRSSERDAVRVADARRPRGSCLAPCVRTTTVTSATQSASSTSGQASLFYRFGERTKKAIDLKGRGTSAARSRGG